MENSILKAMINLFYPLRCQVCGVGLEPDNKRHICLNCYKEIRINAPPFCIKCGRPIKIKGSKQLDCHNCKNRSFYFNRAWAACKYENVIKECLHSFKYKRKLHLLRLLSELMHNFTKEFIEIDKIDLLCAVPLSRSKLREREFNQSQLLAEEIAKKFNKKISKNNLRKVVPTPAQAKLKRDERLSNLKNVFKIKEPSLFKGKSILLIDDVFTTGSTMNECSRVLKETGAKKIYGLVLARGN